MAKRQPRMVTINAAYVDRMIAKHFESRPEKAAKALKVSKTTIIKAKKKGQVDPIIFSKLCNSEFFDKKLLLSLGDQISLESIRDQLGYYEPIIELDLSDTESRSTGKTEKLLIDDSDVEGCPKIFTFMSIKGGVGKTTLAINVAIELAQKLRVALVDVDLFTFGATRWFKDSVPWKETPLTFLDLALSEDDEIAKKIMVSRIPVDDLLLDEALHYVEFIPAYAIPNSISNSGTGPPTVIDWSVAEAQKVIKLAIDRLRERNFDVLVLDCHPGFISLTDAICSQADCNILVSDYDFSTLHANWFLAWQMEHRNLIRQEANSTTEKKTV